MNQSRLSYHGIGLVFRLNFDFRPPYHVPLLLNGLGIYK